MEKKQIRIQERWAQDSITVIPPRDTEKDCGGIAQYDPVGKTYKEKVQEIALEILDYLATLENGVEIFTSRAIKHLYGDCNNDGNYVIKGEEYKEPNLIDIDYAVKRNASKKGLKLDSSKYDDMVLGLPHNIGYVVTKKNK